MVVKERTETETTERVTVGGVDPLDIPYLESGLPKPLWYNPIYPSSSFRVHAQDRDGNSVTVWVGRFRGGLARYETPRHEQWVRAHLRKLRNGNDPERWLGDNLDEEDRIHFSCTTFDTRNSKAAADHQKFHKCLPLVR